METQKPFGHHKEFKKDKFYYKPSYGRIEFDGEHFSILKSKEKKEDFSPISLLHNPLKTRLRFLELINKYYRQNDRHLNIGLGLGDYEIFLSKLPIKLYSVEHPDAPALREDAARNNIAASKTQVSKVDISHLQLN